MSVTSALYSGVSGLLNQGEAMNVIGNNISNVNTIGFKQGRTIFADLLSQNVSDDSQIGKGVQLQAVQNTFTQGTSQNSENVTDLTIQGNSFFALKPPTSVAPVTNQSSAFLSRAGAFKVDNNLTLVNPDGYQVLDTSGNPIKFSDNATGIATAITGFNTANTATLATSALITTDIATAQAAVTAMPAVTPAEIAAQAKVQTLVDAATAANTAADSANTASFASPTAANALAVNNSVAAAFAALQTAAAAAGTSTAAATATAVTDVATNYASVTAEEGKAFGKVVGVSSNGLITYLSADGITQNYYDTSGAVGKPVTAANALNVQRLAVVTASDPSSLSKVGGSLYQANEKSGVATTAFTLGGNRPNGTSEQILSNSLEGSNVDMASEFVKMIVTQRAYSANSKTITTADQMTQEVLGLIR
jgi:flagellar hook protein FlgE